MKKSLITDQSIWVPLSKKWSDSFTIYDYLQGVIAVDNISNILNNAPTEVGGNINFGVTRSEVDELIRRRQTALNFLSSIHYEVAELVDIPYTQKVDVVTKDLYELDPKDYRTEKPFLWFERGNSLEELLVGTITDSMAKQSYKYLVKALNEDTVDASLTEILVDANFWSVEFEKSIKARELADTFITEHTKDWNNYSDDEKLDALNDYASDLGDIFENGKWYDVITWRGGLITEVNWFSNDPNYSPTNAEANGYTYSTKADGIVYLNDQFKNSIDSVYNISFAVKTVTHECRHQFQGNKVKRTKDLPGGLSNTWTFDTNIYTKYWRRPWETDARAWAGLINN